MGQPIPHGEYFALIYQCGIANVFRIAPATGTRRRIRQSDFQTCEIYAAGLRDGRNREIWIGHCDKAGDIEQQHETWMPGPGSMFAEVKRPPATAPQEI